MTKATEQYVESIRRSGYSIYDPIEVGDPDLWVPTRELQALLDHCLRGLSLAGLALRTRSKVVKQAVCAALGYPVPRSFRKIRPRFPGQCFDTYVQKSNNLQIWNEEISPARRYVLIRVSSESIVCGVRALAGDDLAIYDTTGTLTQKYQARLIPRERQAELVTEKDTDVISPLLAPQRPAAFRSAPTDYPQPGLLLPIAEVHRRLSALAGTEIPDVGRDQERNRGGELHRLVCRQLGYQAYADDGRFPDVKHQLLEIKLQTSPTIDLGLVRPDSLAPLDMPQVGGVQLRHCDVRYALFYATRDEREVTLTNLYLTTGEGFFGRFPQFQGRVLNRKLQIPLPSDFFD